jgi:hypothetical protein
MNRWLPLLFCIIVLSCQTNVQYEKPSDDWISKYSQQSYRTDPGIYAALYDDLPQSFDSLCDLIKCQLIHPLEAREMGLDLEEFSQDGNINNVEELLAELDSTGLSFNRKTRDRLVVACYHHGMLLTSILRHMGYPVRMRAGFSRFYEKEFKVRFGHIVCELWDEKSGRWVLIDPDRNVVDLRRNKFDFASEAWINVTKRGFDENKYTSSASRGMTGIVNLVVLDAALLTMDEKLYWQLPEVICDGETIIKDFSRDEILVLDELANYCLAPDTYIHEIEEIYQGTDYFRASSIDYDSYVEMVMSSK